MIVFGKSWAYSVQGRKVEEIMKFLHLNLDYTFVEDEKDFSKIKETLRKKIDELNSKDPKTVKYALKDDKDYLRIVPAGSVIKGLAIEVLRVRKFKIGE